MVEHADLIAVVHESVSTSKELAAELQEAYIKGQRKGEVTISAEKAHVIAAQLRITANLIVGLLEENSQIIDSLNQAVERLNKK